jgi:hypothetical protein
MNALPTALPFVRHLVNITARSTSAQCSSGAGLFTLAGGATRVTELAIELRAIQDDLLGTHRINGAREVTGIQLKPDI